MSRKILLLLVFLIVVVGIIIVGYNRFYSNIPTTTTEERNDERETLSNGEIYVYALNENFTIFIKGSNEESHNYIGYEIGHFSKELDRESPASNYDVWKLNGAHEFTVNDRLEFRKLNDVVRTGEWELALKESDASDFIGGTAHGDEITTEKEIRLDGEEIASDDFIDQTAQEFTFTTTSDLYRDNTITEELEKVGTHNKIYTFNKDGLTLEQEVTFEENMHLNWSYLTMLPILREKDGRQVTDTYIVGDDEYDVTTNEFEEKVVETEKAIIKGEESGITAKVEITEKSEDSPTNFYVANSDSYNKLYFSFAEFGYEVEEGTTWKQTTHFDIDTSN